LLHASFRPRLATTPLRFAITSPPSGCEEDLHLQAIEHARHTTMARMRRVEEPAVFWQPQAVWKGRPASSSCQHSGQVFLAVSEVAGQVIVIVFQSVLRLTVQGPRGSPALARTVLILASRSLLEIRAGNRERSQPSGICFRHDPSSV
jgi:hypothetical protein